MSSIARLLTWQDAGVKRPTGQQTSGGVVTYNGPLKLESLKVRTSGQQSTLSLANCYGKLQELKTSSRRESTGVISSSATNARYGYDPLDRRLWKEQYRSKAGQSLAQPLRTYYLYADEGLIAQATQPITVSATANASPQIYTQYGPRPNSEFTTGILFVKTKNTNNQDTYPYLHHNHLETPLQATDKQGNIVWAAQHEPFGKTSITTPIATADKPTIQLNLRMPGQYEDEETGLHYNWHRYYDPETGRYISQDPISLLGGINRFVYVTGTPLYLKDPMGLWATYVHTRAGFLVFGGELTQAELKLVADAQFEADSGQYQDPEDSHRHAMSYQKNSPAEACRDANIFVANQFAAARSAQRRNDRKTALREFAIGLHTLQDSTSPTHSGF
jgi:RHS repeat-associated protein